jgi:hypothetical protein
LVCLFARLLAWFACLLACFFPSFLSHFFILNSCIRKRKDNSYAEP